MSDEGPLRYKVCSKRFRNKAGLNFHGGDSELKTVGGKGSCPLKFGRKLARRFAKTRNLKRRRFANGTLLSPEEIRAGVNGLTRRFDMEHRANFDQALPRHIPLGMKDYRCISPSCGRHSRMVTLVCTMHEEVQRVPLAGDKYIVKHNFQKAVRKDGTCSVGQVKARGGGRGGRVFLSRNRIVVLYGPANLTSKWQLVDASIGKEVNQQLASSSRSWLKVAKNRRRGPPKGS